MKSEKEILEALNTLKNFCLENNANCENCILRNGYDACGVLYDSRDIGYYKVEDWKLNDPKITGLIFD